MTKILDLSKLKAFVDDKICSIGDKSGDSDGHGISSRLCVRRKSILTRAEWALALSCRKTVTLGSLQLKAMTIGSRT